MEADTMTKKEEAGMVVVVLLLLASFSSFAYGMGKSMAELSRPCVSEDTR
jgi:hypothetical protein